MGMNEGRVAVVTGASRGIGRAIARRLAADGVTVLAWARGDHAIAVVEEIRAAGGTAEARTVDVTDDDAVAAGVDDALARFARIDVLVNNAGITRDQLAMRMKRDDWDAVLATNLTAAFTCIRVVLRPMVKQRGGRIVNVSSVVGQAGNAGQANYAASKAGLIGLTKALALEVASRNVTVNAVAPGLIDTDMTRGLSGDTHEDWAARIPLKRLGTAEEVAAAVAFLASDEAAYITGHVLAVNGGMYL
jgi:3-oxoacyl-[acyl-carrier protein] reductase